MAEEQGANRPEIVLAGELIATGNSRILQVKRVGRRKLFNLARKQTFLEWFAATSNVSIAAEKAGVCYRTVCKHRMKDPDFARAWGRGAGAGLCPAGSGDAGAGDPADRRAGRPPVTG